MVTAVPTIAVDIVAIPAVDTFSAVIPDSASKTPVIVVIPEMTAPPTILERYRLSLLLDYLLLSLTSEIRNLKDINNHSLTSTNCDTYSTCNIYLWND